jgi:hypothetical protein
MSHLLVTMSTKVQLPQRQRFHKDSRKLHFCADDGGGFAAPRFTDTPRFALLVVDTCFTLSLALEALRRELAT